MKEMSKMHEEDAHDDNLMDMETSNQMHTRAQMRAAENAANSHIWEPTDVDNDTNSPLLVRKPSCACYQRMRQCHTSDIYFAATRHFW